MRFIPIVMATMVDDSVHRVKQKLPNKKNKERIELHHSFEQSLSEYSICFTIAFYLALHMAKNKHRYMNKHMYSLICKEDCIVPMGWCIREPYCLLSSAVCNATFPTLPLFKMAESACSPFCYVLHYHSLTKFIDLQEMTC